MHIYAFTFSFYEYRLVFWLGLKEALYALLDKQASVSDAVGFKSISQIMYLLQNGHSIAISIPVTVSQPYHGLMNLWTDISFHSNFAEIWYGPFGSRHTHYRQQVSFGFFFLSFLPYGTKAALFVILLLFIVFSAAYKSPRLLPCLSPRTLQVCLWSGQTMMTIVKSCLLGWMAGLICSMQATGWQQHMCWWQPHTGQFLAQYNTFHCTPVA